MSEWWTYQLSDLLLFSPRVYYRLFERMNEDAWPWQLAYIAAGLGIAAAIAWPRAWRIRVALAVLGAMWIWLSWWFFWSNYASINWAADWIAPVFVWQGGVLLLLAGIGTDVEVSAAWHRVAASLIAAVVLLYPAIAVLAGRPLIQGEAFGIAPDPTAIVTLLMLAALRGAIFRLAMVLPVLWCLVTALTLGTMGSAAVWAVGTLTIAALALSAISGRAAAVPVQAYDD